MSKVPATTRNSGKTSLALPAPRVTVTRTSLSTMTRHSEYDAQALYEIAEHPERRPVPTRSPNVLSTVLLKLLNSAYVWCDALRIAIESEIARARRGRATRRGVG